MEGNRIDARLIQKKASASFRMGDRRPRSFPVQVENQRRPGTSGRSRNGIGGQIFRCRSRSGRAGASRRARTSCWTRWAGSSRRTRWTRASCRARWAGGSRWAGASRRAGGSVWARASCWTRWAGSSGWACASCRASASRWTRWAGSSRWTRASCRARWAGTGRSLPGPLSAASGRPAAAGNTTLPSPGLGSLFCRIPKLSYIPVLHHLPHEPSPCRKI